MPANKNRGRAPARKPDPKPQPQPASSAIALYETARTRIETQIGQQAGTVANGGCDSHETYLKMTGAIKGMQVAINILEGALKGLGDDEPGDQLPEMK